VLRRLPTAAVLLALLVSGCGGDDGGGGSGGGDLRERVEARFAQEGVALYESVGFYGGGGPDVVLAPEDRRGYLGDFVVHVLDGDEGFEVASAGSEPADADGVHWTNSSASASNPAFIAVKRYGEDLALQMTFGEQSIDDPEWEQLDAIMRELAG
jgi:hypothetical protein